MEATRQLGVRAGISTDVRLTPQHRDLLSGCTVRRPPRRRGKVGLQAVVRREQEANTREQNGQMVPWSLDRKGETWCPHGEVTIWKTEEHGGRNKKTDNWWLDCLPARARQVAVEYWTGKTQDSFPLCLCLLCPSCQIPFLSPFLYTSVFHVQPVNVRVVNSQWYSVIIGMNLEMPMHLLHRSV